MLPFMTKKWFCVVIKFEVLTWEIILDYLGGPKMQAYVTIERKKWRFNTQMGRKHWKHIALELFDHILRNASNRQKLEKRKDWFSSGLLEITWPRWYLALSPVKMTLDFCLENLVSYVIHLYIYILYLKLHV